METKQKPTTEDVKAALGMVQAVAECIRELKEVPSGHLYARLMEHLTLEQYQNIISILIRAGVIKQDPSYLLVWIG